MRILIINIFLVLLLIGCVNKREVEYQVPEFPNKYQVKTTILNDSTIYRNATQILYYDSLLIIADVAMENNALFFDCEGKYIKSFCKTGNGPGELVTARKFSMDKTTGILYIHDHGKLSMVQYFVDNIIADKQPMFKEKRLEGPIAERPSILFLKDSFFVTTGVNHRLFTSTSSNAILSTNQTSKLSIFESEKENNNYFGEYSCHAVSPSGTKYVSASMFGGIIEIFSITKDKINLEKSLCIFPPVFDKNGLLIIPNEETIYGFACLATTDEYIYVTVFGQKNPKEMPSTIWQFNWEGQPVCSYKTTHPIECFTIDENTQTIFASVYKDGEQVIAKIDLKDVENLTD